MAGAMLMLAAAVAWMLYRKQSQDGTLPSLSIKGAQVDVTNVNAVETRKIWQFRGIPGQPDVAIQFGLHWEYGGRQARWVGNLVIIPGRWVSHRPDRSLVPLPPGANTNAWSDALLDFDSWWVPRIVTLREAQQLDVLELPEQYRENVADLIQT